MVREDSRKLKDMFVINSLTKRPTLEKYRYEMPGEKDLCQYELWIIDIEKKTANRVPADKWTDQYIQVIQPGEKGDKLFFQRFKRTWDEVDICVVNTETLEVKELIHEVDKPYRDYHMQNTVILNDGKDILFRSERTGWGHYYHYDGEMLSLQDLGWPDRWRLLTPWGVRFTCTVSEGRKGLILIIICFIRQVLIKRALHC